MASPLPSPTFSCQQLQCLSFSVFLCVNGRAYTEGSAGGGGRDGGGAKSDDSKKAWSSINHSLLSELPRLSEETARCPYTCPMPLYYKYFFHADKKIVPIDVQYAQFCTVILCRWFRFAQLAKGKKSRP